MTAKTAFGSINNYDKGGVEITGDDEPSRYLFSNVFDVASRSAPWERVVVAKNLEFTVEATRMENASPWYICAHDETLLIMEGSARISFIKPDADADVVPADDKEGAVRLDGAPTGSPMGHVEASQGHLTLLPAGAAYQVQPDSLSVGLFQSVLGEESIEKWAEICQR